SDSAHCNCTSIVGKPEVTNRDQKGDTPPGRSVTFLISILLRNSCPGKLADQAVEISRLLILWILAAPVEDTHVDPRIHTLKGIARLGRCQRPFATQYDNHRHLQTGKSLVYIHSQVIAEERSHGKASIGLVRTG